MNSRLRELIRTGCAPELMHQAACLNGKGGSAPAPPDYTGAAVAQSQGSEKIANQQTWANRPDQFSPWGSTTWGANANLDPATGQPVTQWTQQQTLNPQLQGALDQQIGLVQDRSNLASGFMGRVANDYQNPFDWTNLPQAGMTPDQNTQTTNAPQFANERAQYTQAMWDQMRPEHQRQEEATRTKLMNQGLTAGSEAYNTELERLSGNQANERWNAVQAGGAEQQRMQQQLLAQQQQAYGQQLGQSEYQTRLRQQAIAEEAQARGMSLNEMNALLTGQMVQPNTMPSFNTASAGKAPDYLGAAQSQNSAQMQKYMSDQQNDAALWSSAASAAGTGASMYALYAMGAFSDIRLKSNIEYVGDHEVGVPIYEYDIFGHRERGVMAQDLIHVRPDLVMTHPSGYLMVNYGGLNAIR